MTSCAKYDTIFFFDFSFQIQHSYYVISDIDTMKNPRVRTFLQFPYLIVRGDQKGCPLYCKSRNPVSLLVQGIWMGMVTPSYECNVFKRNFKQMSVNNNNNGLVYYIILYYEFVYSWTFCRVIYSKFHPHLKRRFTSALKFFPVKQ